MPRVNVLTLAYNQEISTPHICKRPSTYLIGIHLGGDPPSTYFDKLNDKECLRWTVQNQKEYNFAILTDTGFTYEVADQLNK